MLTPHTNATAKPPKGSRGKGTGPRQLSLWGSTSRTASKTAKALGEHSLRDIAVLWSPAAKQMDLVAVQQMAAKCQALAESVTSRAATTHRMLKDSGLSHPADVAAYLTLRELDDKGRLETPEHRLKVVDFGITALVGP